MALFNRGFERSQSKSSPLEKIRSKLANSVELSWGLAGVTTRVASFDGDLLIGIFWTGFTLTGLFNTYSRASENETLDFFLERVCGLMHARTCPPL